MTARKRLKKDKQKRVTTSVVTLFSMVANVFAYRGLSFSHNICKSRLSSQSVSISAGVQVPKILRLFVPFTVVNDLFLPIKVISCSSVRIVSFRQGIRF